MNNPVNLKDFTCRVCREPYQSYRSLRNHYQKIHTMWIHQKVMIPFPIVPAFQEEARQIVLSSEISSKAYNRRARTGYVPPPRRPPFRPPMPTGFAELHGISNDPRPRSTSRTGARKQPSSRDQSINRTRKNNDSNDSDDDVTPRVTRSAARASNPGPATSASPLKPASTSFLFAAPASRASEPTSSAARVVSPRPARRRGVARLPPASWLGWDDAEKYVRQLPEREKWRPALLSSPVGPARPRSPSPVRNRPAPSAALGAEGQVILPRPARGRPPPARLSAAAFRRVLNRSPVPTDYQPLLQLHRIPILSPAAPLPTLREQLQRRDLEPPYLWPEAQARTEEYLEMKRIEYQESFGRFVTPERGDEKPKSTQSTAAREHISCSQWLTIRDNDSPAPPLRFQPLRNVELRKVRITPRTGPIATSSSSSSSSEEDWYQRMDRTQRTSQPVLLPAPPMFASPALVEPIISTSPYNPNDVITTAFVQQLLELDVQNQDTDTDDADTSRDLFPSLNFEDQEDDDTPWARVPLPIESSDDFSDDASTKTDVYYVSDEDDVSPPVTVDQPDRAPIAVVPTPVLAPVVEDTQLRRAHQPSVIFIPVPIYVPVIIVQYRDRSRSPLRRSSV
jgi:hypothetical protein